MAVELRRRDEQGIMKAMARKSIGETRQDPASANGDRSVDRVDAIGEAPSDLVERCCHGNLALAGRKSEWLGSSSGRRRCLPILERFASEGAERVAGNKMALNVERVMDDGVNG